jgi:cobalt/nickel transport protein
MRFLPRPPRCLALLLVCLASGPAFAHFGMVIPSRSMINTEAENEISLDLLFWHPFEGQGMHLAKPTRFSLFSDGARHELLASLTPAKRDGYDVWKAVWRAERPGLYAFVMEPEPYWAQAEKRFIVHITKAYVAAFGDGEGWDKPLGLAAEIVPLCAPYGLYTGNVFQGQVLVDGKPAPGAPVEVEWYSGPGKKGHAPGDLMITQTVRADPNGIFTYAAPKAGWWGFAALSEAAYTLPKDGAERLVELGAVLWVRFYDMQ